LEGEKKHQVAPKQAKSPEDKDDEAAAKRLRNMALFEKAVEQVQKKGALLLSSPSKRTAVTGPPLSFVLLCDQLQRRATQTRRARETVLGWSSRLLSSSKRR
jgi:hypothetical protein